MNIILLGSSGLIGEQILNQLDRDPQVDALFCPARRPQAASPKVHFLPMDPNSLPNPGDGNSWAVLCALGTTIKAAGSREAFESVDYGLVLAFARMAKEKGILRFGVVSALGADPGSSVFYNQVKGKMERDLRALGFPYLTIVQPSLLLGKRREFRLGEKLAQTLTAPVLRLIPKKYRPIQASRVAHALAEDLKRTEPGIQIIANEVLWG